jgi:hypothetical protein
LPFLAKKYRTHLFTGESTVLSPHVGPQALLKTKNSALLGCPILFSTILVTTTGKIDGFLSIGLCPQVAVPERPQVAVVCAPKWPWISI